MVGRFLQHDLELFQFFAQELALAACSYAIPDTWRRYRHTKDARIPTTWPWEPSSWKPTQPTGDTIDELAKARIRDLVKAGALIAAEIDRLLEIG